MRCRRSCRNSAEALVEMLLRHFETPAEARGEICAEVLVDMLPAHWSNLLPRRVAKFLRRDC